MNPGEYPQPLSRVTNVQFPATSGGSTGYVAARLRRTDALFYAASGDDTQAVVTFQNLGSNTCTVQLKQCTDYSTPGTNSSNTPTGTRFALGNAVALVPGGVKSVYVTPWMNYLEVWSTFGASEVRMQIDTRLQYTLMAFDKSETINDPKLYVISPVPIGAAPGPSGPFQ